MVKLQNAEFKIDIYFFQQFIFFQYPNYNFVLIEKKKSVII